MGTGLLRVPDRTDKGNTFGTSPGRDVLIIKNKKEGMRYIRSAGTRGK